MAAVAGPDGYPLEQERPHSAQHLERPPSAPQRPSVRLSRLKPLHAGAPGPLHAQLLTVVEALLRAPSGPGGAAAADLASVEGVCRALRAEPSLAWAAPHAPECLGLLRERRAASREGAPGQGRQPRRGSSARRSQALASRLCGSAGRLPPMGGGGPGCAVMLARSGSESRVAMSQATAFKLAGVDEGIAAALSQRVQRLALERGGVGAWLVVETCRDCAQHSTTFRHEEKQFISRYVRLKKYVEAKFPAEFAVDMLVPREGATAEADCCSNSPNAVPAPKARCASGVPPLRIGAFEVYLCCPEPLVPFSSVTLPPAPPVHGPTDEHEQDAGGAQTPTFSAVCVSSKLQTLAWPVASEMLRRLVKAMPRVLLRVTVRTGAELPVPGIQLEAAPDGSFVSTDDPDSEAAEFWSSVVVSGITDSRGKCKLLVPFCVPLCLRAWHELLMAPQERNIVIKSTSAAEAFTTETVVQLWESEEDKELVVYCTSPRESMTPPKPNCRPFQGRLLGSPIGELRPNPDGYVRGDHSILDGITNVASVGWRMAQFTGESRSVHGSGQPVEVARLAAPLVKVSLVSACCTRGLACAQVAIDEEDFGETGPTGSPVVCSVKCGAHTLEVRHVLAPEVLKNPLTVSTAAPCGVQVRLSPQRLRFVCVRSASNTDLWIVGGRVAEWRRSPGGPPSSADVWLWDGELRGPLAPGARPTALTVKAGILPGMIAGSAAGDCHLSQALALPESIPGSQWQVSWHPVLPEGKCIMGLVADMAQGKLPARWMARLAEASEVPSTEAASRATQQQQVSLKLRMSCCCNGLTKARVIAHGDTEVSIDEQGCAELPCGRDMEDRVIPFRIDGVPPSLLPGNTHQFVAHEGVFESVTIPLDVLCDLWIYWIPPEEEEDDLDEEEPLPYSNGLLWVAADAEHVPDEAKAIAGVVKCSGAAVAARTLDGSSMGPFRLEADGPLEESCLLAGLEFDVAPVPGFDFLAAEPSPLRERCAELGDCELQRLFQCPASVGTFRPLPPPPPHQLRVRTLCCGRAVADAAVAVDGARLRATEGRTGCFRIPRRRLGDGEGSLQVLVENVVPGLLPGGACEHAAPYGPSRPKRLEVDVSCLLWVYWIPPDDADDDGEVDEEDELPPEGLLWVACAAEQVPPEARPVTGMLECPGAQIEELTLDGTSMGPFALRSAQRLGDVDEGAEPPCLLSSLRFSMTPPAGFLPEGFTFLPREPSPLAERCSELGGCELQRLMGCPVAVGTFRANPLPPLQLTLRTSCCGCDFAGAGVAINGKDARPFDASGCLEVKRRRKGGALRLAFDSVPSFLLPGGSCEAGAHYGPLEPEAVAFEVSCTIWVYCVPPSDDDGDDVDPEDEPTFDDGFLWLACDREHVPEDAVPAKGVLECRGATVDEIILDGSCMGPFTLRQAAGSSDGHAVKCLLSGLSFAMTAPFGFEFHAKSPSPLAERCEELGGCEMQRLLQCPMVVGTYKSLPPVPPLSLALRSSCCGRGFSDAKVTVSGCSAAPLSRSGCFRLPRRRREEREGELHVQVGGVAACLLPGGVCDTSAAFGGDQPECLDLDISCLLYVYWVPPEVDEEEEEEGLDPPDGLLWVAVDPTHMPEEAKPVKGLLQCPGAQYEEIALDGNSMGPFELRMRPGVLEAGTDSLDACLLSRLTFCMESPDLFEFRARDPSPLAERCEELGGCELQRLSQCPSAVGNFKPLPLPALRVSLLTACCRCPFAGATACVNGGGAVPFAEDGSIEVARKRAGGALRLSVGSVPPSLLPLPRGGSELVAHYTPSEPLSMVFDVACLVWVYWVPPDEEEEEEDAGEEGEALPPPEGTLWIACDAEQVADEALPVRGALECPGSVEKRLALDGSSMGPFQLHSIADAADGPTSCIFSGLAVHISREDGYAYRAKDPSPLAERCEELGGCELQRLLSCPVVMGFLRPV